MTFEKFLTTTATEAGKVLLHYFSRRLRIEIKKGAGIVTQADKNAEKVILRRILREFPKSSIITEESGEFRHEGNLTFVIDPLDGTSNYAHGFPWFCVSIGLHVDGKP